MHVLNTAAPFQIKSDPEDNTEADNVTKALSDFQAAVDDRLAELEKKTANDNKTADRLKAIETRLNRPGAGVEVKSADDAGAFEQKAFVSFLRRGEQRIDADEAKTLTRGNAASAGYLAPPQFAGQIIKYLVQFSPIRAYAGKIQISGSEIIIPRRTSIINGATWVAEQGTRPDSNTTFERVTLKPIEMATFIDVTDQLLEDSVYDLEGEIAIQFGENFAKTEGTAFVNGSGVNEPMGLLKSPQITAVVETVQSTNGLIPNVIAMRDLIKTYHALPSVYRQNAVWLMNSATLGLFHGVLDNVGRPILIESAISGVPGTILGRPVVESPDMPDYADYANGNAPGLCPIIFGDLLGGYKICDPCRASDRSRSPHASHLWRHPLLRSQAHGRRRGRRTTVRQDDRRH